MGRRRNDSTGEIAKLVVVASMGLAFAIIHYAKVIAGLGIIASLAGLTIACAFGLYHLGRKLWQRCLNLSAWQPEIDWNVPAPESCDAKWPQIQYPKLTGLPATQPANVIGTSGAWKDVTKMLAPFPFLTVVSPDDLKQKIKAFEVAMLQLLQKVMDDSFKAEPALHIQVARCRQQIEAITAQYERSIRGKLARMEKDIHELERGSWLNRIRADRLSSVLIGHELELNSRLNAWRKRNGDWEQKNQAILNPQTREEHYRRILTGVLGELRAILQSKEFSGAVAEMAVIGELQRLPPGCFVVNDLRLKSPRYIQFEGKPLMSAQIDTVAITPAGVFVVEVKNWSGEFAESGRGFNPYEQVSRAGYLVYDRLRDAGIQTRVTSIVTAMGRLPERNGEMVVVKPVRYLRGFIQSRPVIGLDVERVRAVLLGRN